MAFDPYCTGSFLLDTYRHEISVPTSKPTIKKRRKATKPTKQQKSQSDNMPVPPSPAPVVGTTPVTVAANALAPPLREAALSLADNALKVAEPDGQDDGSWVAAAPIPRVQVIEKRKRTLSDFNKPEEVKKARRDEGLEAKGKQREILGAEGHSPPSPQLETCPAGNDDSDGLVDPATRAYMDNILAHISASAAAVDLDEASSYNKENWFDPNYALPSTSNSFEESDLFASGNGWFALWSTPQSEAFLPGFGGETWGNDSELVKDY